MLCALVAVAVSSRSLAQEAGQEAPPPAEEKLAAVVNGDKITETELAAAVQSQLQGRQITPEQTAEIRRLILDSLIDARLVAQFLADKKIVADPKEVDTVIEDIKGQVAGAGLELADILKRQGQTEDSLRSRIAEQFAFRKYADSQITDASVQSYFTAHKEEFDGTEVRASHLLLKVDRDADREAKKAAAAKIAAIRKEIEGGLDFAEAAKKHSDCPSSSEGGDLGFFPRHNRMVEPFAAAAFALAPGSMSEPVETQFGLHLIKVTERKPGDQGLDDVRDEVKEVIAGDLWEKAAKQQRAAAKIEIVQ